MSSYLVTMVITKFVQVEFNREVQVELVDTNFWFWWGLSDCFYKIYTCKNAYISYGDNEIFISSVLGTPSLAWPDY